MRRRPIWIILAIALAARAAFLLAGWNHPERFLTPDSHDYDDLAAGLVERGEYSQRADAPPELFRAPGYPIFLAGVYSLTGHSPRSAILVQILLDVLLCYVVYRFGRRVCSPRAGLLAAAAFAASPAAVAAPLRLLSESFFALLLGLALLALAEYFRTSRRRQAVLAGVLMGLAALVRQIALPFVAVPTLVMLFRRGRRLGATGFALAAAATIAPWVIRNYVRAGYPQLAGVADYNLFACNALPLVESRPDILLTDRQRELSEMARQITLGRPEPQLLNDPALLRECRREGLEIILHHPFAYAAMHARTVANVFVPAATELLEVAGATKGGKGTLRVLRREGLVPAMRHYFSSSPSAALLAGPLAALTLLIYLAAIAGLIFRPWWRLGAIGWVMIATVLYFVVVPGPVGYFRFRVPIEPAIALAAGAGLAHLARAFALRRVRRNGADGGGAACTERLSE